MICLDCESNDIRYDEESKSYYCNNCGSKNYIGGNKLCKHMRKEDCICLKGVSSTGICRTSCSYYES